MSRPPVVDEEVFSKARKLLDTGLFSRKQIAEMMNINKATINTIALYRTLEEMRAAQRAAAKLAAQRREEKERKEQEAKEAYYDALKNPDGEPEEPKRIPIGDCPNTVPDDDMNLKADIIIEKLDTLIELLKEVRVAQTSTRPVDTHNLTTFFESNKPF